MVYLFVLLALICLTLKGYCGKKVSAFSADTGDAFLFNLVRMLLCVAIGFVVLLCEQAHTSLAAEPAMLLICFFSGLCNAAFLVGWLLAIQKNAMVAVDVTLTLGSLLPALLCALLFGETLSWQKLLGFALIVAATALLSGYSKQTAYGFDLGGILLLLLAALGDGLSGFCQQLYRYYYTAGGNGFSGVAYPKSIFHFYTYLFAALILAVCFACYVFIHRERMKKTNARPSKARPSLSAKPLIYILIMAICLFAANYFQTVATNDYHMPSQVLYPVIKGGCLVSVTFTAMLCFGERPTRRSLVGSLIALVGIVAIGILP